MEFKALNTTVWWIYREWILDHLQLEAAWFKGCSTRYLSEPELRKLLGNSASLVLIQGSPMGIVSLEYQSYAASHYRLALSMSSSLDRLVSTQALRLAVASFGKTREFKKIVCEIPSSELGSIEILQDSRLFTLTGRLPERHFIKGQYTDELQFICEEYH